MVRLSARRRAVRTAEQRRGARGPKVRPCPARLGQVVIHSPSQLAGGRAAASRSPRRHGKFRLQCFATVTCTPGEYVWISGLLQLTLASKVLSGSQKPTTPEAKKLAASVLSQDEKKGQRK